MLRRGDEPIPGYRLEKFLGKGQFGEVWKAIGPGLTEVALKFIDLVGGKGLKELRAMQLLKTVRHANLLPVSGFWMLDEEGEILDDSIIKSFQPTSDPVRGTLDPTAETAAANQPSMLVVAMSLADKSLEDTLNECLDKGQSGIEPHKLLRYMEEAARAIDYLNSPQHVLGTSHVAIQHCDIKPANIMLVGDSVQICDFGLARMLEGMQAAATATNMVGSPAYMAPECIERKPSSATDQYSLAVTYVELRTGRLPFHDESYVKVLEAHVTSSLDLSDLSPSEQSVIRRATSLKPQDRYPTTLAMVEALRGAVFPTVGSGPTHSRTWAWVAVAGLLVACMGFALWYFRPPPSPEPQLTEVQLIVRPSNATLLIDGQRQELSSNGGLTLNRPPGTSLSLECQPAPASGQDYQPLSQTLQIPARATEPIILQLEYTPHYYARQAFEFLDQSLDKATSHYVQAVNLDANRYAVVPGASFGQGHTAAITCLSLDPQGKHLYSADADGVLRQWSADLSQSTVLLDAGEPIDTLVCYADWVITIDGFGVTRLLQLSTGMQVEIQERIASAAVMDVSRGLLILGELTGDVWKYDISQPLPWPGTRLGEGADAGHQGQRVTSLAWVDLESSTSQPLLSAGFDNRVLAWDVASGRVQASWTYPGDIRLLKQTDHQEFWIAGESDSENPPPLTSLRLNEPDRVNILATGPRKRIECWARSADGHFAALADDVIYLLDLMDRNHSPEPLLYAPGPGNFNTEVLALAFVGNRALLAAENYDNAATLWQVQPRIRIPLILNHASRVTTVHASADGMRIYTGAESGLIRMWDAQRCLLILRACEKAGVVPKPSELRPPIRT